MPEETPEEIAPAPAENQSTSSLGVNPSITEDWNGGYKLEINLTAETESNDWKVDFNLPYNISAAYGVDLINHGDGNYTISGQNDQVNLSEGQSIKPIFIVEDNGQQALVPGFDDFPSQK